MEAMRQSWSDDRLDGLSERVDLGFKHVDAQFRNVGERLGRIEDRLDRTDERMEAEFAKTNARIENQLDVLNTRFDRFYHVLIVASGGVIATLIGGIVTAVLTQ